MSDEEIRDAERAYRASGAPQDGEAYVQAVLRSTGLNSTFLIARVIETQRAIAALIGPSLASGHAREVQIRGAFSRPVTPDDMVSFLRGGREWLEPPVPQFRPTSLAGGSRIHVVGSEGQPLGQTIYGAMVEDHNDPNAHLPHQRGVPAGSAILCNHANENPGHCPCEPDCYCRQDGHTCSDVEEIRTSDYEYRRASTGVTHRSRLPECRLCSRGAQWQFRQEPRLHVCAIHLAECRVNRAPVPHNCGDATCPMMASPMSASLADMVRHHEAVDDV